MTVYKRWHQFFEISKSMNSTRLEKSLWSHSLKKWQKDALSRGWGQVCSWSPLFDQGLWKFLGIPFFSASTAKNRPAPQSKNLGSWGLFHFHHRVNTGTSMRSKIIAILFWMPVFRVRYCVILTCVLLMSPTITDSLCRIKTKLLQYHLSQLP